MQFSAKFIALASVVVSTLLTHSAAGPAPVVTSMNDATTVDVGIVTESKPASYVVSYEEMMYWLATTDAVITFIGEPINPLLPRAAQNTILTYCNQRIDNVCGGTCNMYNGNSACLDAPGTNCLSATTDVGFCDGGSCGGSCNQYASCGTPLDNGFCYTPGTASILVPFT